MSKTAVSVKSNRAKVEIEITAAMVVAIAGLTTAEVIDISSVVANITGGGGATRAVEEEYVVGSDSPILDYSTMIPSTELGIEFLYTEGKETLGTDGLDLYTDILRPIQQHTASDLPVPITYSLGGGDIGDEQIATSPTETFITDLPAPVGGVGTSGRVKLTASFKTPTLTLSTVA